MELPGYKPCVALEGPFNLLYLPMYVCIDLCFDHGEALCFDPLAVKQQRLLWGNRGGSAGSPSKKGGSPQTLYRRASPLLWEFSEL